MKSDMLLKRKAGLFGLHPGIVRDAPHPFKFSFWRGPHLPLKLGNGGGERAGRGFVCDYQAAFLLALHVILLKRSFSTHASRSAAVWAAANRAERDILCCW